MSIGAISSAISYYSLGSVSDYDLIKQKLIVLGVVPSGQESVDRAKLKQVQASQNQIINRIHQPYLKEWQGHIVLNLCLLPGLNFYHNLELHQAVI
jgi:hypothetical protein